MSATKSVEVGFTVTGEFLTEHSRDRLYGDENPDSAIEFLTESLDGMTFEIAVDILLMRKKLTGVSGRGVNTLALADDIHDPKRVELLNWHHAGTVRVGREFWMPYAEVTSFGVHDVVDSNRILQRQSGRSLDWEAVRSRAAHYMDSDVYDRCEMVTVGNVAGKYGMRPARAVLFRKVSGLPHWLKVWIPEGPDCWNKAVEAYEKTGKVLEERGHCIRYPEEFRQRSLMSDIVTGRVDDGGRERPVGKDVAADLAGLMVSALPGVDPEQAIGTVRTMFGLEGGDTPEPAHIEQHNYGWLLPNGTFYACTYFGHSQLCGDLLPTEEDPQNAAESLGWVKLTKDLSGTLTATLIGKRPTRRQLDELELWKEARGRLGFDVVIDIGGRP